MSTTSFGRVSSLLGCCLLVATGCGDCTDRTSSDGWTVARDARDTAPKDCPPGRDWDPESQRCVGEDDDTDTGVDDTSVSDTSPADTPSSDADSGADGTDAADGGSTRPEVGQSFQGPTVAVQSDTPVRSDHGLGLYWKNALVQFGDQALHQHIPNQRIMDLSRIRTETDQKTLEARLPKAPARDLHFYRNYCDEVGASQCNSEGIVDDVSVFAMAMIAQHRAPAKIRPSDCTWGMIYGKTTCDFGTVLAPSRTILLYAYQSFDTSNYPVFGNLGISSQTVARGYHLVLPAGTGATGRVIAVGSRSGKFDFYAGSRQTFPMLYP